MIYTLIIILILVLLLIGLFKYYGCSQCVPDNE